MVVRQTTKPVHPIANVSITKLGVMPIDQWNRLLIAGRTMPASTGSKHDKRTTALLLVQFRPIMPGKPRCHRR
ncbi:hypothetical protein [Acinetobacter baumannii]|nr:hypothetical protein [Acinetobacter baumannii]MDP4306581.1 hypothetical protein [Acinetobacter baumannii]